MTRKYVWWQPPDETLADRRLLLAQMMTLGTADDVRWLLSRVSEEELRSVLENPPIGIFNGRSWHFWHLRLGRAPDPGSAGEAASTMTFKPRLDILSDEQRRLWPALADVPESFVLYGGTGLALRLGHRTSVDFAFFSFEPIDFEKLFATPFVRDADVLQRDLATLTVSTPRTRSPAPVKVSFFGGLDMGRVGHPERTNDGVARVAAILDLFATKLKVLLERVAARDYVDVAAIPRSGASSRRLGPARRLKRKRCTVVDWATRLWPWTAQTRQPLEHSARFRGADFSGLLAERDWSSH